MSETDAPFGDEKINYCNRQFNNVQCPYCHHVRDIRFEDFESVGNEGEMESKTYCRQCEKYFWMYIKLDPNWITQTATQADPGNGNY